MNILQRIFLIGFVGFIGIAKAKHQLLFATVVSILTSNIFSNYYFQLDGAYNFHPYGRYVPIWMEFIKHGNLLFSII